MNGVACYAIYTLPDLACTMNLEDYAAISMQLDAVCKPAYARGRECRKEGCPVSESGTKKTKERERVRGEAG